MTRFVAGPVLGIETSGSLTGAALFLRGRLVAEFALDARATRQEVLLDLVMRQLQAHEIGLEDVKRIGVALGPGSFTGIRVGLAAARALALGAGIPLVGVPSHQALAWPWRDLGRTLVLLTGLRRGEVYLEVGRWRGDLWAVDVAGESVPVASVGERLGELPGLESVLLLGEAALPVVALHPQLLRFGLLPEDPIAFARRPGVIACLAARLEIEAHGPEELEQVRPLYLRGADARPPGGR